MIFMKFSINELLNKICNQYICMSNMKELSKALIQLEQVNLAGQQRIGKASRKKSNAENNPENLITDWQIFEKNVKNIMYIDKFG